jgi:hypothetical protein
VINFRFGVFIKKFLGHFNPDCPLAPKPFALSLSKGRSWFDKLTTNGAARFISPNGQSGFN